MKLGIIALTPKGVELAQKISALWPDAAELYYPLKVKGVSGGTGFSEPLHSVVPDLFVRHKELLFIMSLGIVVRVIAPCLKDKYSDPAVVVMDEKGQHAISVLSGHLGGANKLAAQIAALVGARPVITTASDLQGKMALDVLAREKKLEIEPKENLKHLNSALVQGERVTVYCDFNQEDLSALQELIGNWAEIAPLNGYSVNAKHAVAFITNKKLREPTVPYIYLRPKNLWVGVGCRSGTSQEEVLTAILEALELTGRSIYSVQSICSVDLKAEEQGLLEAAKLLGLPLQFFSKDELKSRIKSDNLSKSSFVLEKIGVEGVCEPAALLGGNSAHLILPKTRWPKVTVAIAEGSWRLLE